MSKVYVVTRGEYSDYSISHVFSTLELAEKYIGENTDYGVEVYDLDPSVDMTENLRSSIGVDMERDGSIRNIRGDDGGYGAFDKKADIRLWKDNAWSRIPGTRLYLQATILTRDRNTAIKTVNEIRTRLIALDRWPETIDERGILIDYETLEWIERF